jgi:hypothetical protein
MLEALIRSEMTKGDDTSLSIPATTGNLPLPSVAGIGATVGERGMHDNVLLERHRRIALAG